MHKRNFHKLQSLYRMQKGRKLRNPVEKLRTQMYAHQVYLDSGMKSKSASEFGKLFEPHKANKSYQGDCRYNRKWEPIINGDSSPNETTRKTITAISGSNQAELLYNSVIWKTLKVGNFPTDYWLNLLKSKELYYRDKGGARPVSVIQIGYEKLQRIALQQSMEGVASLIVLLRYEQSRKYPCELFLAMIDDVLFRALVALAAKEPIRTYIGAIWTFMSEYIILPIQGETKLYRYLSSGEVNAAASLVSTCEAAAIKMGLLSSDQEYYLFRYISIKCNLKTLFQELSTGTYSECLHDRGVAWLNNEMSEFLSKSYANGTSKLMNLNSP